MESSNNCCALIIVLNSDIRCFKKISQHSIDNASPTMELFYVTPYNCMDHCVLAYLKNVILFIPRISMFNGA